jgi:hypothetical protein
MKIKWNEELLTNKTFLNINLQNMFFYSFKFLESVLTTLPKLLKNTIFEDDTQTFCVDFS